MAKGVRYFSKDVCQGESKKLITTNPKLISQVFKRLWIYLLVSSLRHERCLQ